MQNSALWRWGLLVLCLALLVGVVSAEGLEANFSAYVKATKYVNVPFTDTSVDATGWSWTFGDGGSSSSQNPTHRYTSNGEFTVTLNVTDGASYSEISHDITIIEGTPYSITDDFSTSNFWTTTEGSPQYTGGTLELKAWGASYETVESKYAYGETDHVIFSFQAMRGYSDTNNKLYVYIDGIAVTSSLTLGSSYTTYTYEYDGDGHYRVNEGTWHNIGVSGDWKIKLRGGSSNAANYYRGAVIDNFQSSIKNKISADSQINSNVPATFNFCDETVNATTWDWSFGDGEHSSVQNPSHQYNTVGHYLVNLTTDSEIYGYHYYGQYVVLVGDWYIKTPKNKVMIYTYMPVDAVIESSEDSFEYNWLLGDGYGQQYSADNDTQMRWNTVGAKQVECRLETASGYYATLTKEITIVDGISTDIIDDFAEAKLWTTTEGSPAYTGGTLELKQYQANYETVESNFAYDEDDNVTFSFQAMRGYPDNYNKLYVYIDGIAVTSGSTLTSSYVTYTYEYDGDGHYRVNGGAWHDIAVSGEWKIKLRGGSSDNNNYYRGAVIDNFQSTIPNNGISANATSGCSPLSVQFSHTSYNITYINWSFGDGTYSNEDSPIHTYTHGGNYTATVNIESETYDCDVTDADIVLFAMSDPPVANFTAYSAAPRYVYVPFTDSSIDATGWNWMFGDGGSSTVQNPTHMYTSTGSFTVTLNITDGSTYNETSQDIYIVADAANIIDENFASSARWTNTEGSPTYTSNQLHLANGYATYDTVESKFTYNETDYVKIQFQATNYMSGFVGNEYNNYYFYMDDISLEKTDIPQDDEYGIIVYEYDGNGHYRLNNGSWNTIAVSGDWKFKLRGGSSRTGSSIVYGIKVQNFYAQKLHMVSANVTSGIMPLTAYFADTSYNTTSWNWSFGDGTYSSEASPLHTFENAGSFIVTLNAESEGYLGAIVNNTTTIQVAASSLSADFTYSDPSGPSPLTVQFTDTSVGISITDWNWSFGDGEFSADRNPEHVYTIVGTYTVALTATNATGPDTETKTDLVHVYNATPDADFTYNATEGYPYVTVQFTDDSSGNNITLWYWIFGDGNTSTDPNPLHNYTEEGTFTVSLTVTNDGGNNTETKTNLISVTNQFDQPTSENEDSNALLLSPDNILYSSQQIVTSTYEQGVKLAQAVIISVVAGGVFLILRRNGLLPSVMGNSSHEINVTEMVGVMLAFLIVGFIGLIIVGV